jgi:hypothetical protein
MKNMLGNNESLRELLQGPIADLLIKLNGENGEEVLVELNKFNRRQPCWTTPVVKVTPKPQPPDLSKTGATFGDWLAAREQLHLFLTGEKVVLRDLFEIPDYVLARNDIMPVFRPAGANNRTALDWKVKLGFQPSYEKVDVMKYINSAGPKVPELYYIHRSIRPDENTLGNYAKSPDQLFATKPLWTGLYGWSDADNLYYLIKGIHLDSVDTLSWFPDDRLLCGRHVAYASWPVRGIQAGFGWSVCDSFNRCHGARLAKPLSLKKPT